MDPHTLDAHRARLLELRAEILDEGQAEIEPNRNDGSTRTDEDAQALNEMNQTLASRHNKVRLETLRRINAALFRIEHSPDDFGYCLECDDPLPQERLALMPYVELCVECQSKTDSPRSGGRKHLTDFH